MKAKILGVKMVAPHTWGFSGVVDFDDIRRKIEKEGASRGECLIPAAYKVDRSPFEFTNNVAREFTFWEQLKPWLSVFLSDKGTPIASTECFYVGICESPQK